MSRRHAPRRAGDVPRDRPGGRAAGPKPSVEALQHELASGASTAFLLASLDGVPVATGVGKTSSIGDAFYTMVRVLPAHRRAGRRHGRPGGAVRPCEERRARLADRASSGGRRRGAPASSSAAASSCVSRECPVFLDLTRIDRAAREPPPGIEIVSLRERPDLVAAAYETHAEPCATCPSAPRHRPPRPFDEWLAETVDGSGCAARPLARRVLDGEVVGWAGLEARLRRDPGSR